MKFSVKESDRRYYRAIISVPIFADDDADALDKARTIANDLMHPGTNCTAGHLELLAKARATGSVDITRVVYETGELARQIHPPTATK